MLRRSVLEAHGLRYEKLFFPCEDHALFCRMIPSTQFAVLPEVLFLYRCWPGNTSHRHEKTLEAGRLGVLDFARRENPELWAMSRMYVKTSSHVKLFGIPILLIIHTYTYDIWKLFDCIPFLKIKRRPVGLTDI